MRVKIVRYVNDVKNYLGTPALVLAKANKSGILPLSSLEKRSVQNIQVAAYRF